LVSEGVSPAQVDAPADDSPRFDSEALWEVVKAQVGGGDKVLLVRGTASTAEEPAGRDWLEQRLLERDATVDAVCAYVRAGPVLSPAERLLAAEASRDGSVWLFSSSQAIANLVAAVSPLDRAAARAIATHPRIAQAARDAGFAVVRVSRPPMDAVIADLESLG
jgi:uroporphyrinogen-III synthase